jgi:hypothetical protein
MKHLQHLRHKLDAEAGDPGDIAARFIEAGDEAGMRSS